MDSSPPSYILEPIMQLLGSGGKRCFKQPPLCTLHQAVTSWWCPMRIHSLALNPAPSSTICTREPRSSPPLHKMSPGSPAPSCHQGSNSSLDLGRGLLVGLSPPKAQKELKKRWEVAAPTQQVGRHVPTLAPRTKRGHAPSSCLHQMLFWRAGIGTMYRPVSLGQPSASQLRTQDLSHSSGISRYLKGTAQQNLLQHSFTIKPTGQDSNF